MMCQKNIELQLQALEIIKSKHGFTSDLFSIENEIDAGRKDEEEDSFVIKEMKK